MSQRFQQGRKTGAVPVLFLEQVTLQVQTTTSTRQCQDHWPSPCPSYSPPTTISHTDTLEAWIGKCTH